MIKPPINDPYDGVKVRPHPAKFSDVILDHIATIIPANTEWIYDPMAGIGKITELGNAYKYHCNEIELEWSSQIQADIVTACDAKNVMFIPGSVVITSPPYGNRMADCFITDNKRSMMGRYAGDLGRRLSKGNAGALNFGNSYTLMMTEIYQSIFNRMSKGESFILNVSNFIKNGVEQNVIGFYLTLFVINGYTLDSCQPINTPRDKRHGANSHVRVDHEVVMKWRKL